MGKRFGAALMVMALVGIAPGALADGPAPRALWVWDAPDEAVLTFATSKGIDVVYLHAPPGFSDDDAFAGFVAAATAAGVTVFASGGTPEWSTDSAAFTGWVDEVVGSGLFAGIVADVEPYLLPDWETKKRNRLIRSYLGSIGAASAAAGDLPFLAAVPFWWDQRQFDVRRTSLVESVLDRVSGGIVVMAYRDTAALIEEFAATEVALATANGKTAIVGVETNEVGPTYVTFFEEGEALLETALGVVESAFGGAAGFGGFAIHDYRGYQVLG